MRPTPESAKNGTHGRNKRAHRGDGLPRHECAHLCRRGIPGAPAFLAELFERIEAGEIVAVTSELTLAEVLIKPLELGRHDVVALYEEMLQSADHFSVLPIERTILVAAAEQRATLGIALADAIHVATAIAAECSILLTNDKKMRAPGTIALKGLR